MKKILSLLIMPIIFIAFTGVGSAVEPMHYQQVAMSKKNPCAANPCGMKNPCAANPCGIKNPCAANPCGAKNPCMMNNPCAPGNVCNPCGASNPPLRHKALKNNRKAVKMGKKLWNNSKLGTSGMSCNSCHANGAMLNLDKVGPFPHYVAMPHDVVTLDQMINYCMLNPMKAKALSWESREMTAMAAYYQHLVKKHKKGAMKNPCAANPCSMKNPCAANPCASKNPCSGW